jgi:hypothetical protein
MPPAAFEPAIPASEQLYAHALYGAAIGINKDEYREASRKVFLTFYFVTDCAFHLVNVFIRILLAFNISSCFGSFNHSYFRPTVADH